MSLRAVTDWADRAALTNVSRNRRYDRCIRSQGSSLHYRTDLSARLLSFIPQYTFSFKSPFCSPLQTPFSLVYLFVYIIVFLEMIQTINTRQLS